MGHVRARFKMIKQIEADGKILAIVIKADYKNSGIKFFTPNEFSQQLAYMNRPAGYLVLPHIHNPIDREVKLTQEVLFIKSGLVRVDFYNIDKNYLQSIILCGGDVILLAEGGHGFQMLADTEIIEVKQGPYAGDNDKKRFDPVDSSKIIIGV